MLISKKLHLGNPLARSTRPRRHKDFALIRRSFCIPALLVFLGLQGMPTLHAAPATSFLFPMVAPMVTLPGADAAMGSLVAVTGDDSEQTEAWTCPYWRWDSQPQIIGGIYQSRIATDCTIVRALPDRIPAFREDLIQQVMSFPKIHSGPTAVRGFEMEGIEYDASIHIENGGNSIDIRELAHIFSDNTQKIVYETLSTDIQATGQAANLRKLDLRTDITNGEHPHSYTVTIYSTTHIRRPGGIPNAIFVAMAKDTIRKQFQASIPGAMERFKKVAYGEPVQ